jgi:hypothetical protein
MVRITRRFHHTRFYAGTRRNFHASKVSASSRDLVFYSGHRIRIEPVREWGVKWLYSPTDGAQSPLDQLPKSPIWRDLGYYCPVRRTAAVWVALCLCAFAPIAHGQSSSPDFFENTFAVRARRAS